LLFSTEKAVKKCTGTIYPHWQGKKFLYIAAKKNSNQTGKKFMRIKNISRFKTVKSPSLGVFKHRLDKKEKQV